MSWFGSFLNSSIGQKIIMSLTGLFLISFLAIHLLGNLQLLYNDGGQSFNLYAKFMTTNPLIKTVSFLLYGSILLHAFQGIRLWLTNKAAKGSKYAVASTSTSSASSRNMAWFGIIIAVFLVLHLFQFWFKMKIGATEMIQYEGYDYEVQDLYKLVAESFSNWFYVIVYVISMIVVGLHLHHGFESAFQSLGLNHKKYTPMIKGLGLLISIGLGLGFAIIPIAFILFK